jgi:hypothetical protein
VTTRSRTNDLTADLLYDIAETGTAPATAPATVAPATDLAMGIVDVPPPARSAFVETSLFISPRTWLRPNIALSGTTLALSAGPIRLRAGRG